MKDHKIDISIITVGMNHLKYIQSLFSSIYKFNINKCYSFEVIYVDNCSSDDSVNFISSHYPDVKIIENRKLKGFGENNNIGVKASQGKYIAIINPDIILENNSIELLFLFLENIDKDVIVAPKLLNPDLTTQFSVRKFMTLSIFFNRLLTKGKDNIANKVINNYLCKEMNYSQIQYIDWAIGAALFMPSSVYNLLGGFDENYFLYVEDEDLCLRAWEFNIPVIYFPESRMIHNHLRASSKFGNKAVLHLKSRFTFFKKHGFFVKNSIKEDKLIHDVY